jgi:hypothetical protein
MASSPLHLAVQSLPVAIGFVGNYAPWDFHPSFGTCPSYQLKALKHKRFKAFSVPGNKPVRMAAERLFDHYGHLYRRIAHMGTEPSVLTQTRSVYSVFSTKCGHLGR